MTDTSKLLTILGKQPEQRKAKLSTMIAIVAETGKASFQIVNSDIDSGHLGEIDYNLVGTLLYYALKEDNPEVVRESLIEQVHQDNIAELISEMNRFYSITIPEELRAKVDDTEDKPEEKPKNSRK